MDYDAITDAQLDAHLRDTDDHNAGYEAAEAGRPRDANPFGDGRRGMWWDTGYQDFLDDQERGQTIKDDGPGQGR
jgi:hypothetical protein